MKNTAINSATFSMKNRTFIKALNLALKHKLDVSVDYCESDNEYTLSVALFSNDNKILRRAVLYSIDHTGRMSKTFRTNNTTAFIDEINDIIADNKLSNSTMSIKDLSLLKDMIRTSIDKELMISIFYYPDGGMYIGVRKDKEVLLGDDITSISEFHKEFNNRLKR